MLNIRDLRIDPASLGEIELCTTDNEQVELGVKIEGRQLLEKPEGFAEVEFTGLELMVYEAQGHAQISAKATGVSLVQKKP